MPGITLADYLLLPFYLWLIYKIAFYLRDKYYPESHPYRPYFITGLTAKIAGSIFIGLVYQYYYNGGDTFFYLLHSQIINDTLLNSPGTWFRLLTHTINDNNFTDAEAFSKMFWYDSSEAYTVCCLGALIGLFCFTKYLIINVLIACLAFSGVWLMFITFAQQYNKIVKYVAIAVLFMPGPIVWGSGLFKDSFCVFAVGTLVYCFFMVSAKGTFTFKILALALLSIWLLVKIKIYILGALLPFLIITSLLSYKNRIAKHPAKKAFFYSLITLFAIGILYGLKTVSAFITDLNTSDLLITAKVQKDYLLRISLESNGSAYDLGDFDPSISGILKLFFPAVNVALFRPYLWESHGIIQLFNAIESAAVFLAVVYLIFKRNLFITLKRIYKDPNLLLCLFFSLVFAFVVGVTSYNFGALSRYKIPATPFFTLFLGILIFDDKKDDSKKAGLN